MTDQRFLWNIGGIVLEGKSVQVPPYRPKTTLSLLFHLIQNSVVRGRCFAHIPSLELREKTHSVSDKRITHSKGNEKSCMELKNNSLHLREFRKASWSGRIQIVFYRMDLNCWISSSWQSYSIGGVYLRSHAVSWGLTDVRSERIAWNLVRRQWNNHVQTAVTILLLIAFL
jgi:hypothetical protein